jgi:hypothetical protein
MLVHSIPNHYNKYCCNTPIPAVHYPITTGKRMLTGNGNTIDNQQLIYQNE